MFEKDLFERIKAAMKKMDTDGIHGYGLNELEIDNSPFGERIRTSGFLNEGSVSGGDYEYKWIPPTGWSLKPLCHDDEETFYVCINEENEKGEYHIIKKVDGGHYQDQLKWSSLSDIPDFLLVEMEKELESLHNLQEI